jgi:tetratricopeptide (TPR) repeat protein
MHIRDFRFALFALSFLLLSTQNFNAQVPSAGSGAPTGVCQDRSGNPVRCAPDPVYYPSNPGPSPEEVRRAAEEKDQTEAADDAYDKGIDSYKRGDYDNAVREFRESLEYNPDDQNTMTMLHRAEQKASEARDERLRQAVQNSTTGSQVMTVQQNSTQAPGLSSDSATGDVARKGIDTGGSSAGHIPVPAPVAQPPQAAGDPIVPPEKRTPAITRLEQRRATARNQVVVLDQKLKTLDPKKDAVQVAQLNQQTTTEEHKIHYYNFSITEQLKAPAPATGK